MNFIIFEHVTLASFRLSNKAYSIKLPADSQLHKKLTAVGVLQINSLLNS